MYWHAYQICPLPSAPGLGEQKCAWLLEVDGGEHLTTFAASTACKEMWLDANEALTAFKDTEFNSVCVITVSGRYAKVAIAVQGEKQFCLEQGKYLTGPSGKCFPDPRKTTVVIYNGSNHYCGAPRRSRAMRSA